MVVSWWSHRCHCPYTDNTGERGTRPWSRIGSQSDPCSKRHTPRVRARTPRIPEYEGLGQRSLKHTYDGTTLWSQNQWQRPQEPNKERPGQSSEESMLLPIPSPFFTSLGGTRRWYRAGGTQTFFSWQFRFFDHVPESPHVVTNNIFNVHDGISRVDCYIFPVSLYSLLLVWVFEKSRNDTYTILWYLCKLIVKYLRFLKNGKGKQLHFSAFRSYIAPRFGSILHHVSVVYCISDRPRSRYGQ